jgi:hypothetical protein
VFGQHRRFNNVDKPLASRNLRVSIATRNAASGYLHVRAAQVEHAVVRRWF